MKDGMVRVPGGRFMMGSDDKKAPANERPARAVVVPPFWVDRTEVTVGAYNACVAADKCTSAQSDYVICTAKHHGDAYPINCVTW